MWWYQARQASQNQVRLFRCGNKRPGQLNDVPKDPSMFLRCTFSQTRTCVKRQMRLPILAGIFPFDTPDPSILIYAASVDSWQACLRLSRPFPRGHWMCRPFRFGAAVSLRNLSRGFFMAPSRRCARAFPHKPRAMTATGHSLLTTQFKSNRDGKQLIVCAARSFITRCCMGSSLSTFFPLSLPKVSSNTIGFLSRVSRHSKAFASSDNVNQSLLRET